jgi:hypothetical protein
LREAEVDLDRRQGDVDDRHVEDDHELRCDDQRKRAPAPPLPNSVACRVSHLILPIASKSYSLRHRRSSDRTDSFRARPVS